MMVEHNQSANNPTNGGYNNAYKFNGKELDDATGMYYYGARYYDPRISIFVSVDPLAEKTMEPYLYTGNNPIMFTDPTGMSKDDIIINNKDKKEIARIKVDTGDKDYVFDTDLDINLDTPLFFDTGMSIKELKKEYDAIGLNLSASGTVGGGMEFGMSFAYFLNGESEGNLGVYTSKGANVGLGGGLGGSVFGANYNKEALPKNFNAAGFAGAYNSGSFGIEAFGIGWGKTYTWSNEGDKHNQVYPGHRRVKTTWTSTSIGVSRSFNSLSKVIESGFGKMGSKMSATYSGGTSKLIKEFKSKKVKR